MGRSESAKASIGIKILLGDIIEQINKDNWELIKEMLTNGFIEDDNEYFNHVYQEIQYSEKISGKWNKNLKKFITDYCKNNGSYLKNRFTGDIENTLENGCLYEKYLLVPIKKILVCERWGYDRDGTNSVSRPIDFDLSVNIEKYKVLEKFEIAFILEQNSAYIFFILKNEYKTGFKINLVYINNIFYYL